MLEAKLAEASVLKKLIDAIKELVSDANFECTEEGLRLQAMDNSHVALVAVKLETAGFMRYRCDRPMPLGMNLGSLTKVLRCAKDDDECTLKAADDADVLNLVYEGKHVDRIAEYDMKLMDIDTDTLGIPETDYDATVSMSSGEFSRIIRDLSQLGESVKIDISKEGVKFSSEGEAANGSVLLKQAGGEPIGKVKKVKKEEEGEEASTSKVEEDSDTEAPKIKKEKTDKVSEDVEMDEEVADHENFDADSDNGEASDEEQNKKKRKKKANGSSPKPSKRAKTGKKKEEEGEILVHIEMNQPVSLTFSLKYLLNFSKGSTLSTKVKLEMSNEVPLLVSFDFGQGHINYYLAPKIGDD